jgi:hypothetical protein
MSYIQLTIGGKPRGLKFNQMAVLTMSQYIDYDNLAATFGYALIYSGLKANCYVKREEPDFDFEKVCEWVEEMSYDDLMKVKDVFESTQTFKTLNETTQTSEKETKKKQRKIISKPTK